jgi:hypothetical protein
VAPVNAVFPPVSNILAFIAPVFAPVAHILAPIPPIFSAIDAILDAIAHTRRAPGGTLRRGCSLLRRRGRRDERPRCR